MKVAQELRNTNAELRNTGWKKRERWSGCKNSKSAAGNLHARVLIELDGGPLALATPFEEEVV